MMEHCHSFKSLDCSMVKPGVMVKIEEEELYDPNYDGRSETSTGYPIINPENMIKEERNEEDSFIRNEEMYEEEESPESSTGHYVKNVVVKRKKDDGAHAVVDQQYEERISSPEPSPDYILVKIKEEEAGEPYGMDYQRRPIVKGTHRRISMGTHRRISMGREKDGRVHRISSKMVIDIDRLIQMVHDRPELYDPKVPSYADRYKKKKAWDEICSVVVPGWDRCSEKEKNLKVKAIKTRWNSCRDQFRRELTVKGKSTEGRLSKRPYIFTNQLMFLRDILHLRQARDSQEDLPEEESEHSNDQSNEQLDAAEVDTPSVSSACSPQPNPDEPSFPGVSGVPSSVPDPVPRSSGTRRREQDMTAAATPPNTQAQIDSRVLDYLKRSSAEGPEDIFLRSLAPHLKRVAPERQLRCQSALMGVIEVFASASDPRELYQAVEYYRAQAEGPSTSGPYSPGPPAPRPSQLRPHESSQSFYSRDRPGYHKPNYYAPPAP